MNSNKLEPLRPSQTSTLSNPEESQKQPGMLPALPSNRVLVGGPASRNPKVKQVGTNQPSQKDQERAELPLGILALCANHVSQAQANGDRHERFLP